MIDKDKEIELNKETEEIDEAKTEREQLLTKMNFAKTQQEIDDIYQALEILSEAGSGEECV